MPPSPSEMRAQMVVRAWHALCLTLAHYTHAHVTLEPIPSRAPRKVGDAHNITYRLVRA